MDKMHYPWWMCNDTTSATPALRSRVKISPLETSGEIKDRTSSGLG
jgi:hypothetical protein